MLGGGNGTYHSQKVHLGRSQCELTHREVPCRFFLPPPQGSVPEARTATVYKMELPLTQFDAALWVSNLPTHLMNLETHLPGFHNNIK